LTQRGYLNEQQSVTI
ncbi:unnamed protein product, partial [Rotaria sp. Silwood1]